MKFKLSFHDYKRIQHMRQKEISEWVESIYRTGYEDGQNAENTADIDIVKNRIKGIKGIGNVLYERISEEIDKCMKGN